MTRIPEPETLVPPHLEDEELLAYLDGELDGEAQSATAAHVERCWSCRTRMNGLEVSIERFLSVRDRMRPTDLIAGGMASTTFRRRLSAHISTATTPRRRLHLRFPLRTLRHAFAAATLVAAVLVMATIWWSVPLSAESILARAEARELLDVTGSNLVVRSVIQVDRIDADTGSTTRLGAIETEMDPASSALSVSVRDSGGQLEHAVFWGRDALEGRQLLSAAIGGPLAEYLALRRWAPGVSIPGYLRLVADRGRHDVSARHLGRRFEVSHLFAVGHISGITEARLHIDDTSWQPLEVSLFTDEHGLRREYRFRRIELQFLPRTAAHARLFASRPEVASRPAPPHLLISPGAETAPRRRPLPLSWADSEATEAEVAVAQALHDVGADLGEELNVFQMSDGSILVQGLVDTADRRQVLEGTLNQVPGSQRVEIYSPSDLTTGLELFDAPWRSSAGTVLSETSSLAPRVLMTDASGLTMPMQGRLNDYFSRVVGAGPSGQRSEEVRRAASAFANDAIVLSRQGLFHAWALHRLALQFSPARVRRLTASTLAPIEQMRRAHREGIAHSARELAARIDLLPGGRLAVEGVPGAAADSARLLRLASDADRVVRQLFTASAADVNTGPAITRLRGLLAEQISAGADSESGHNPTLPTPKTP